MPKLRRPVAITAFFIAIFIVLLSALGVGITYAYHGVYYPGVKVGSVNVGGLTKEQAKAKLDAQVSAASARTLTVALPNIREPQGNDTYPLVNVSTTAGELGWSLPVDAALDSAWQAGHQGASFQWVSDTLKLFFQGGRSFSAEPVVDETKVRAFVDTKVLTAVATPEPAKITVDAKTVTIVDQVQGLAVDAEALKGRITATLQKTNDAEPISFRLPATLADAAITRSTVEPLATQLGALGDTKVTLASDVTRLVPARAELLQWFTPVQNDKGELSLALDSARITSYLQKNGKSLDQKKSLAAVQAAAQTWLLKAVPTAQVTLVEKPKTEPTAGAYEAGLFEGKYIYVNLSEQKLYRLNGTTLEKVYTISSGKWSTPTPKGTFHVGTKVKRAYSREFGLYMPYWQNLLGTTDAGGELPVGSYGLHELPEWPNGYKEGQGHLGTPVSHGCVRLGIGDAEELYNWTEAGTAVVIK